MANEFKVKNGLITPDVELQGATSGTTMLIASATASGTMTVPSGTDTLVAANTGQTLTNKTINGTNNTISNVSLTAAVTGILSIANGGTGENNKLTGFNALAPTTTKGDLILHNGTNNVRVPVGATNGHVLTVDSAEATGVKWAAASGGGGVTTISFGTTGLTPNTATSGVVTVAGTLAIANGGTGQTTQTAAFDALSPLTTKGDILVDNGTNNIRLPVGATNGHVLTVDSSEAAGIKWGVITLGTTTSYQIGSLGVGTAASGTTGEIRATNNITAYYTSDRSLKENIRPITNAVETCIKIGGKLFDWTEDYIASRGGADGYFIRKQDFGVIAQDLQAHFPLAVRARPDGLLAVDYEKLVAVAFQAIYELNLRLKQLEDKHD